MELEKSIHDHFRGREELPALPKRVSKAIVDHSNAAFLEDRRVKNVAFLENVLTDPSLSQLPMVASFLGFPAIGNVSSTVLQNES